MFAPYMKDKSYYGMKNEEDILLKSTKVLYAAARLQSDDFDNHRSDACARDNNIGNSGNGRTNGYGGGSDDPCDAADSGPAGNPEWPCHVCVRRTCVYKSQAKNAAKP